MPGILDWLGIRRKPSKSELVSEQSEPQESTGVRNPWSHTLGSIEPARLGCIIDGVRRGEVSSLKEWLQFSGEMPESDAHYFAQQQVRYLAGSGHVWSYTLPKKSRKTHDLHAEEFISEVVGSFGFRRMIQDMKDNLARGYSVAETVWDTSERQWWPRKLIWRDPSHFSFSRDGSWEPRRLTVENPTYGEPLTPFKYIVAIPSTRVGHPMRRGIALPCAFYKLCKSYLVKDMMALSEVFGRPVRVAKINEGNSKLAAQVRAALRRMSSDAYAILPHGVDLEFQQAIQTAQAGQFFETASSFFDKQISKAWVGQTMTADDGSSLAQAKVHEGILEYILASDSADESEMVTNYLYLPWLYLNHGEQKIHSRIVKQFETEEDLGQFSTAITPLIREGLRIPADEVREKFGLSKPKDDEEVIGGNSKEVRQGENPTAKLDKTAVD